MTTFPGSPRLPKGAIVGLDPANPLASMIVFQYNPDTMTRRLDARSVGGNDQGDRSEAFRLIGPPRETITMNAIEIDAVDQLEQGNANTLAYGITPILAALELLLYPKSQTVNANIALARACCKALGLMSASVSSGLTAVLASAALMPPGPAPQPMSRILARARARGRSG